MKQERKSKYKEIWELAKPYLKKATKKDMVIHTKGVIFAMTLLLKEEEGNKEILIPSAILHDVGFSKVPKVLQTSTDEKERKRSLELHLEYAPEIIEEILNKVGYNKDNINKIIEIVVAHKFQDPKELDKQLLIDADTLADLFKEQFYTNAKDYNKTPQEFYNIRKDNKFYTKTAKNIFDQELKNRAKEIFN